MTGQEQARHLDFATAQQGPQCHRHGFVDGKYGKILEPFGRGHLNRQGGSRHGGFETHPEKDDVLLRIFPGQGHCVQRRVHHPDLHFLRPFPFQGGGRTWHPYHVAESGQDGLGEAPQGQKGVNVLLRSDTDRASRPGNQF
jgi:hypothetical protein